MIMPGSLYLTDSQDLILSSISNPMAVQRCMVIDLDEQSDELEKTFRGDAIKGTVLLPPPSAVFREIDGDHQGFIDEYTSYLKSEYVLDYISSLMLMVYSGINTLLYVPCFSEDSVWINILMGFFEAEFGMHIGTNANDNFFYNNEKDVYILNLMFMNNCIDVLSYLREIPPYYNNHPQFLSSKIAKELSLYTGDENPTTAYYSVMNALHQNPKARPAIAFDN